jgi:hypothetical protein
LHLGIQSSRFNDVFKGISIVASVVVEDSKSCPVDSLAWVLIGSLLEVFQGFLVVFQSHITATQDVKGVSLALVPLLSLLDVFKWLVNVSLKEVDMGEVLIDLEVSFIMVECGFIRPLSLLIVSHIFVQDAYLEESVYFSLYSKSVSEDWILEIANGLINLVCLGKYYT